MFGDRLGKAAGATSATGVERANARLPSLPGPSVSARIRTAEQERDRLKTRVEALEQQLKEKEQELERIRKTIRP